MKAFESLKIEVLYFEQEDVVRTSNIGWFDERQPGDGNVQFDDLFGENA